MEVDGFEPPRPRRAQDLQSRAIDRYAIPPKYKFQDAVEASRLRVGSLPLSYENLVQVDGIEPLGNHPT